MAIHFKIEGKIFKRKERKSKNFKKSKFIVFGQFYFNLVKNSRIKELINCKSKNTSFINPNWNFWLKNNWIANKEESYIETNQFKLAMGNIFVTDWILSIYITGESNGGHK